ncbi:recombinase family protein [Shewanella sp. WXL01]|nr:recombinase family protein [Shewanella sp. WXL01]
MKQVSGSGLKQQTQELERISHDLNLPIDKRSFSDEGKSAFHGKHLDAALGDLLALVQSGEIARGSVIVVSNADRLSRQSVDKSTPLLLSVLSAGIGIYTTMDNRLYTSGSPNLMVDVIMLVLSLGLGHEESKKKSQRVSQAALLAVEAHNKGKRCPTTGLAIAIHNGNRHPFWVDTSKGVVDKHPLYFTVAKDMLTKWLLGWTVEQITDWVNSKGLPRKFTYGGVNNFLTRNNDDAFLGTHTIKGTSLPHYYPPLLSAEQVDEYKQLRAQRTSKPVNSGYYNRYKGVFVCGICGCNMVMNYRKNKGVSFLCGNRIQVGSSCMGGSIKGTRLDLAVLAMAKMYVFPKASKEVDLEKEIADKKARIIGYAKKLAKRHSDALESTMLQLEDEVSELEAKLAQRPFKPLDEPLNKLWDEVKLDELEQTESQQPAVKFHKLLQASFKSVRIVSMGGFTTRVEVATHDDTLYQCIVSGKNHVKVSGIQHIEDGMGLGRLSDNQPIQ